MTTTVPITMRADPAVKAGFEQICSEIGLSVNTALNIFVKRSFANIAFLLSFRLIHSIASRICAIFVRPLLKLKRVA